MGRSRRTLKQVAEFAETLDKTGSLQDAALAAGYSTSVAKRGKADLPAPLLAIVDTWQATLEDAKQGALLNAEIAANAIKGTLVRNMHSGEPGAEINAAKTLGTMKDYNLFQSDNAIGVVVVQPSPAYEAEILRSMQEELDAEANVIPALPPSSTE
jgi:hypothetical protein